MTHPDNGEIERFTDHYFNRTKQVIGRFGDSRVTYAIFMRRPVVFAPRLALEWLEELGRSRNTSVELDLRYAEGKWVGAGEPMMYITGSFFHLVDLETIFLQKLGPACVAAYNAWTMCADLPKTAFLAMDARHCAGQEMAEMMAYAASVGSARAKRKVGAVGFIGNATHATAHFFGRDQGLGTMPHALVGYAQSTLRAAEMYHETFPGESMTVLVDYFAREISDSLEVCRRFPELAAKGMLSLRVDTTGGRYIEGLDPASSYAVLERFSPESIRGYRSEEERGAALPRRHRRVGGGDLPFARRARSRGLRQGADRGFVRLQPGQVPGHGRSQGADRCCRLGLVPAVELDRDLRHRRHRRVRRREAGQDRPRVFTPRPPQRQRPAAIDFCRLARGHPRAGAKRRTSSPLATA